MGAFGDVDAWIARAAVIAFAFASADSFSSPETPWRVRALRGAILLLAGALLLALGNFWKTPLSAIRRRGRSAVKKEGLAPAQYRGSSTSDARADEGAIVSNIVSGSSEHIGLFPALPPRWITDSEQFRQMGRTLGFLEAEAAQLEDNVKTIFDALWEDEDCRPSLHPRPGHRCSVSGDSSSCGGGAALNEEGGIRVGEGAASSSSCSTNASSSASGSTARLRGPQLHEPIDDFVITRFLLAAKNDRTRTINNLREYLAWRRALPGVMRPPDAWLNAAAVLIPFEDRFGRPVVLIRAQYLMPDDPALFEEGFCSTLDAVIGLLMMQKAAGSTQNWLDQYTVWIDTTGAGMRNVSLPLVKVMQRLSTNRYAERVAKMYVLFPGVVVRTVWRTVKGMLLERTQNNIAMVAGSDVAPTLRDLLGPNAEALLPPHLGGRAVPFPLPQEASTLEAKAGRLAAASWRRLGVAPSWDAQRCSNDDDDAAAREGEDRGGSRPDRRARRQENSRSASGGAGEDQLCGRGARRRRVGTGRSDDESPGCWERLAGLFRL